MDRLAESFREQFDMSALGARLGAFVPNLVSAIITIFFFYLAWRLLRRITRAAGARYELDETAASFLDAVLKYTILSIGVIASLNQIGVHTASLLTSVGVLGLTIGFAARDALSNIISGIFIFWDRPFVIGDLVEIEGRYGRVSEITMRSTRVVTPDGKMLAIPNSTIVNTTVASYTNFPHLRLDIAFSVGVGEDLARIERLVLEMCVADPETSVDNAPVVRTTELGDYNIGMELQLWIDDERKHIALRSHFRRSLFETLRTAGVDMPYETLQLQPVEVRSGGPPTSAAVSQRA